MKVSPDLYQPEGVATGSRTYRIPGGLVGFPEHRSFDLVFVPDQEPFLWLQLHGPSPLNFVAIEPQGIIPDYEIDLFDEDADFLGIKESSDAIVLNIVTLRNNRPDAATVNLTGPVIINRHTGIAKQCIVANYFKYSARHPLVASAAAGR